MNEELNDNFVLELSKRDTDISQHILFLYVLPFSIKAKTIVEIGCGQSTFVLTAIAKKINAEFYSIDLNELGVERGFPNMKPILDKESCYHSLQGDSRDIGKTWNKPIDFLFIDSSHEYEQTVQELDLWIPFVKKNGVICMHDTNPRWEGVNRALKEFLEKHNQEYKAIHFLNQNGFSILLKQ